MVWTILFAILFFSLIIFVHELGHFMTARFFKVTVHEFAIGMGPKLFSWGKKETKYSIRAIPVGGFCKMEGEDEDSDNEGSFSRKPWYARLIILASGAGMNIILGFVVCLIYIAVLSAETGTVSTTTIAEVKNEEGMKELLQPGVTIASVGDVVNYIQPGDRIVEVNGSDVNIKRDMDFAFMRGGKEPLNIVVERGGEEHSFTVKPYVLKAEGDVESPMLGVVVKTEEPGFFNVLHESFFQTIWMGKTVFVSLGMLISGEAGMDQVSGPVGVVSTMNTAAQAGGIWGLLNLLMLGSLISVNIGIMNLLPFPALDGGRIFFVIIEAIRRKPTPPEKEGIVHLVGLILLFGLMIFATWNDIIRLISG